jgi:hypothetical protein
VQTLPDTKPQFAFPMEWDNFAALPVSTHEDWWTRQIDNKTRNVVRKSQKSGIQVREVPFDSHIIRGIHTIYNETPVRQGKHFWHYGKSVERVARENATFLDQSVFIGAFLEDVLIGFVKLVLDKDSGQGAMMQILSLTQHRDKAPTNALISQAVGSCADRKIPYLVYARLSYGKKSHDSLVSFKLSNGFKQIDVPRYFLPLSLRGTLALTFGLHRPLVERIPESALNGFRKLRRTWHARMNTQVI